MRAALRSAVIEERAWERAADRPLFVAGRGAVSGFGDGLGALIDGVFGGRTALRPRERLAAVPVAAACAAELPAATAAALSWKNGAAATGLPLAMARRAAAEALVEARDPERRKIGLILATTKADLAGIVGEGEGLGSPGRLARALAAELGLGGPRAAVSCACASALAAVALARRWAAADCCERILVVGVDALSEFIVRGFAALLALDPDRCRPFDRQRKGLSLGEAAGAVLLSRVEKDSIGCVITGHGESNDAHHVTAPSQDGRGLALAVRRALQRAGRLPADVDVVHLHGTGTPYNDAMEARALAAAFGGPTPPAFGSKAQTGHTLGASGAIETLILMAALERGVAPANAGLQQSGVDARLRLVTAPARLERRRVALKVSGGFGGINAALVVER